MFSGAHRITARLAEAILMSTHNISFYEDLTKIIFELSSNIIKYTPYFFCCSWFKTIFHAKTQIMFYSSLVLISSCILHFYALLISILLNVSVMVL